MTLRSYLEGAARKGSPLIFYLNAVPDQMPFPLIGIPGVITRVGLNTVDITKPGDYYSRVYTRAIRFIRNPLHEVDIFYPLEFHYPGKVMRSHLPCMILHRGIEQPISYN